MTQHATDDRVDRFRRTTAAAGMVAGPLLMAVASATKVVNDADAHAMLTAVAAAPGRAALSDVAQLGAAVALVPATVGLLRFFPGGRGTVWGHLAVGLLFLNLLANAADVVRAGLLRVLVDGGVTAADVSILEALSGQGTTAALEVMVPLGLLGFPLLAFALWRARTVARWIPGVLLLGVVCFFFPVNEGVGASLLAAGFVALATDLVRGPVVLRVADAATVPVG